MLSLGLCCFGLLQVVVAASFLDVSQTQVSLGNDYTRMTISTDGGVWISSILACFDPSSNTTFVETLASGGFVLEREDADGTVHSSRSSMSPSAVNVISNTSSLVAVQIHGVVDSGSPSTSVNETWLIQLAANERHFTFSASGSLLADVSAKAVRHSLYVLGQSVYGHYARGVSQMMAAAPGKDFFGSVSPLSRVYMLGGGSSIDVQYTHSPAASVLLNSNSGNPYWSGVQHILAGSFAQNDVWQGGWKDMPAHSLSAGLSWSSNFTLAANSLNFPVTGVPSPLSMPAEDVAAALLGVYPSAAGCLVTYFNATKGQIATTPNRPTQGYQGNYNFFDPDNFFNLGSQLSVGDPYLADQARLVIEHSGSNLLPSGQLPHHFVGNKPTYIALSGATQTGPNIFWTLTCFRYASATGNTAWLRGYMPTLRRSLEFLLGFMDPRENLLRVPGSLMIDTFRRTNYTTDSNAMMTILLRDFAEAETRVGNNTGAASLNSLADTMSEAIAAQLWSTSDKDHFVTQRNLDGSVFDMVDYDANLIAVAAGVPTTTEALSVLKRIDGGRCAHGRATFVSERWYGPDDCFKQNVGDSWTAMGRIGWFDALARRQVGDVTTFNNVLLSPLQGDLLRDTFLRERYGCDGKLQLNRTQAYFEYPSVVTMMVRDVKYGIRMGLNSFTVDPFMLSSAPSTWIYDVGNVYVSYSTTAVVIRAVGDGDLKAIRITGLTPNAKFSLQVSGPSACSVGGSSSALSSSSGELSFSFSLQALCEVSATTSSNTSPSLASMQ